jgi:ketosteroid isomerase-like protein
MRLMIRTKRSLLSLLLLWTFAARSVPADFPPEFEPVVRIFSGLSYADHDMIRGATTDDFLLLARATPVLSSREQHPCTAEGVRKARERFNNAIENNDIDAIAAILDDDVVLVTGTGSDAYVGREPQLNLWRSDVMDPDSLRYLRETNEVQLSPLHPLALESGQWTGTAADHSEVGGEYSAKWRCANTGWLLEAETFMTTRCSGSLCDQ